jgi:hypothetical protein
MIRDLAGILGMTIIVSAVVGLVIVDVTYFTGGLPLVAASDMSNQLGIVLAVGMALLFVPKVFRIRRVRSR